MTWVLNILVLSVILSFTKVSDRENNGKINQLSLALFEILPKLKLSYESIKGYLSYNYTINLSIMIDIFLIILLSIQVVCLLSILLIYYLSK